jgi:hypothetical protein
MWHLARHCKSTTNATKLARYQAAPRDGFGITAFSGVLIESLLDAADARSAEDQKTPALGTYWRISLLARSSLMVTPERRTGIF